MAGPDRQTADSLTTKLTENPYEFDFYAAVRLIQSRYPEWPRIGYSLSPSQDPVRFAQNPSLAFAPSTLERGAARETPTVPTLYSRHFGLFGPHGPLPLCLTEYANERIQHFGDRTFAAFCDIFHHRLTAFFFRAWADARKTVDYDRPGDERWGYYVGSLVGLGMDSLHGRDSIPDRAKSYYASRLAPQARNAEGLESILQDFFGLRTEVQEFAGRWLELPPGSECRLGASPETGRLGLNAIAGSRIWSCQLGFRVRMGPLTFQEMERMLPSGESFQRLADWIAHYASGEFFWDLQLVLASKEVPQTCLGKVGRLGWTTWLKTQPFEHDADDLVVTPPNN